MQRLAVMPPQVYSMPRLRWSLRSLFIATAVAGLLTYTATNAYRRWAEVPIFQLVQVGQDDRTGPGKIRGDLYRVDVSFLDSRHEQLIPAKPKSLLDVRHLFGICALQDGTRVNAWVPINVGYFGESPSAAEQKREREEEAAQRFRPGWYRAYSHAVSQETAQFALESGLERMVYGPRAYRAKVLVGFPQDIEIQKRLSTVQTLYEREMGKVVPERGVTSRVEVLFVHGTNSADTLRCFAALPNLRCLALSKYTCHHAEDLSVLSSFPRLEMLGLVGDKRESRRKASMCLTAQGMRHVAECARLRYLILCGHEVTDDSLSGLSGAPALEEILLVNTQVTDEGIEGLKKSVPSLQRVTRWND